MFQTVKGVLKYLAPAGSRRWAAQRWLRRWTGVKPPKKFLPPATALPGMEDPYNLRAINRLLRILERPTFSAWKRPSSESEAARWVLATLMARRDLRRRYPQALRGGRDGGFCRALCARLGERSEAAHHVRAAFARGLDKRPRMCFENHLPIRQAFPFGLTPVHRTQLLLHFLLYPQQFLPLTDEEILWFHLVNAEDPHAGLVDAYLSTPTWQERVPNGLTASGWGPLRTWLRQEYGVAGDGLDGLPVPPTHDAAETACLDWIAQAREPGPTDRADVAPYRGANAIAHFHYPSGLREAAFNTVRALRSAGLHTSCRNLPTGDHDAPDPSADYRGLEPYDVTLIHVAPEPLLEPCYSLSGLWQRPGVHRVGVWYWELETAPPQWARHAGMLQEVWAPTRFIFDALRRIMPIPVTPMLPGMLPPVAPNLPRDHFGLDASRFLFLFLFDMRSEFERKNPLAVVAAFRRAFGASTDVQLAVKVSRGTSDPASFARLREACDDVGCVLIDRVMSREESFGLLNACDAYVSLHRSEGFGLTMAEAMFLGKPVIATGYSGNLDFMSPENSLLVPYEKTRLARDYAVYRQGCVWAEPSVVAAAEAMRRLVDHPNEARTLGERARCDVTETLSLEAYGRRMRDRLEQLHRTATSAAA